MKLTWFAGMTFRLHIGGEIVVTQPDGAPEAVEMAELVSGADRVVRADAGLPAFDAGSWRPRKPVRLIDAQMDTAGLAIFGLEGRGIVLDGPDEGLVVLCDCGGSLEPQWGRWADSAVVVLSGGPLAIGRVGQAICEAARPKLIALAVPAEHADAAFEALAPHLEGISLTVLDPGLAVEI